MALLLIKRCGYARTRVADTFMENTSGEEGSLLKTHKKVLFGENAQDHRGSPDS